MGPLPGRELLVEPGRRSGLAVGIAQERGERRGADEIAQLIGADYGFGRHEISPDTQKPGAWPGFWRWVLARGAGRPGPPRPERRAIPPRLHRRRPGRPRPRTE